MPDTTSTAFASSSERSPSCIRPSRRFITDISRWPRDSTDPAAAAAAAAAAFPPSLVDSDDGGHPSRPITLRRLVWSRWASSRFACRCCSIDFCVANSLLHDGHVVGSLTNAYNVASVRQPARQSTQSNRGHKKKSFTQVPKTIVRNRSEGRHGRAICSLSEHQKEERTKIVSFLIVASSSQAAGRHHHTMTHRHDRRSSSRDRRACATAVPLLEFESDNLKRGPTHRIKENHTRRESQKPLRQFGPRTMS